MSISPSSLSTALLLLLPALSLLQLAAAGPAKVLPKFIHVCKMNEPDLGKCVMNSIESMRPQIVSGIPEFSVPPLEPLHLHHLNLSPNPNLHSEGHNILVHGGGDFKIQDLKMSKNDTDFGLLAHLHFLLLTFVGYYTLDGRVLVLPVKGNGSFNANASDIMAELELKGKLVKHKGEEYLRFNEASCKVKIQGPLKLKFDNLFNGDKALGDATNAAMDASSEDLKRQVVEPRAGEIVAEFALAAANNVTKEFPFQVLFPKD